jgi:retron-type reverse transcriptase
LELKNKIYHHSNYKAFKINDPKPRDIHKASVKDRLVHHAIYRVLYPFFDTKFVYDSYSCRLNKGTHKAIQRFEYFYRKVSKNNTKQCYVLKCDIKKFFANIDHNILKQILQKYIKDVNSLNLLSNIIDSFCTKSVISPPLDKGEDTGGGATSAPHPYPPLNKGGNSTGLPLGNLTSQLLVNIYMNELDRYVKHNLKVKYYIRYADDFVILSQNKLYLENLQIEIDNFLKENLKLHLHPNKVFIKTIASGVDFLGWVHFPKHQVLRTSTKNRMFRNLKKNNSKLESASSYLGMIKWGNGFKLEFKIKNLNI